MLSLVADTHLHVSDDASSSGIPSRPQPKVGPGAISFVEGPSLRLAGHPRFEEVMKYARLTAITILLSAGAADTADAVAYKDIAGQWSGDVTDYVFTPNMLTVKFHDGRPASAFKITKYTYTNDSVSIDWVNAAGKSSVTVFGEFGGVKPIAMAQQQEGDKPRRAFHRC